MNINELVLKVHENAKLHGWWDKERTMPELLCLVHSEISEALEEIRDNHAPTEIYYSGTMIDIGKKVKIVFTKPSMLKQYDGSKWIDKLAIKKPEGVPMELADAVIRIMDICGHFGIDLEKAIEEKMKYNETRPFMHGGKKL